MRRAMKVIGYLHGLYSRYLIESAIDSLLLPVTLLPLIYNSLCCKHNNFFPCSLARFLQNYVPFSVGEPPLPFDCDSASDQESMSQSQVA